MALFLFLQLAAAVVIASVSPLLRAEEIEVIGTCPTINSPVYAGSSLASLFCYLLLGLLCKFYWLNKSH